MRRILPGELTAAGPGPRARRSARDWVVDVLVFGWAVFCWLALLDSATDKAYLPGWLVDLDAPLGALACLMLWVRRRWPLGVALAVVPAAALTDTVAGALMVIVFNLALRVPPRPALLVLLLHLGVSVPYLVLWGQDPAEAGWQPAIFLTLFYTVFFLSGSATRARRQLVLKLREDAVRERADHERRLADVRGAERRAIAREMHDVLAHRVSLLSVHAGALAYRTQRTAAGHGMALDETEIAQSASVIRDNAHQALEELREVLHVLREDDDREQAEQAEQAERGERDARGPHGEAQPLPSDGTRPTGIAPHRTAPHGTAPHGIARPQPDLDRIEALVDEARAAGQHVTLSWRLTDPDGTPPARSLRPQLQRTAYRVVQEGLTNARKHAPGAPVTVGLAGARGEGLRVEVGNPLPVGVTASGIPGANAGLTGLRERLEIEGGTLGYGTEDGTFRLYARLPWPS